MKNRIREFRKKRGWSLQDLADEVGDTSFQQMQRLETGKRNLNTGWMERLSKAFGVRPTDLLIEESDVPIVGYVGAGEEIVFFDDYPQGEGFDRAPRPPEFGDGVALEVRGNSMVPRYREGELVYYEYDETIPAEHLIGCDCVVRLPDDTTFLKILEKGSRPGCFTLRSYNPSEPLRTDLEIVWVAKVAFSRQK